MANASVKQSVTLLHAEGDAWPEMREVIRLRGSERNKSRGEQDRKQRFITRLVTTLIFGASPKLNPTSMLLKFIVSLMYLWKTKKVCKNKINH